MLSDDINSDPATHAQAGIRSLSVFLAMLVFVAVAIGIFINMIV